MIAVATFFIGILISSGFLAYLLTHPETIEKWSALLFKALSGAKGLFKGAHKQYIKFDLQGRVNEFVKSLKGQAPFLAGTKIQVEWVGEEVTRKSFLQDGKVVLRLRRDDHEETNFVHAAYLFVAASLLAKSKRYLSPPQSEAIDLYVTTKLLEKEKTSVVGAFLDNYLHPRVGNTESKVSDYYDSLAKLDRAALFYPVLLQELEFLGDKVFGGPRGSRIVGEVNALIQFLVPVAERTVGDQTNLSFLREYCRFAIVIVGRSARLELHGSKPYIEYIRRGLIPRDIETIYVCGSVENQGFLNEISSSLGDAYDVIATRKSKVTLRHTDVESESARYIVVLRRRGVEVYEPSV